MSGLIKKKMKENYILLLVQQVNDDPGPVHDLLPLPLANGRPLPWVRQQV